MLDVDAAAAHGSYFPYDGVIRKVPGVFVDRSVGARLKTVAAGRGSVRLTLAAKVKQVSTRNLVGFIPGASSELTFLHTHTDGTNGLEEDGALPIVAISQYLARLPRRSLPRTVMVVLTTGHFAGQVGLARFVARHRSDLLRRTAAGLTLEHLGAREEVLQPDGSEKLSGKFEIGAIFTPENSDMVNAGYAALVGARAAPAAVVKPFVADPQSPDRATWPGEGSLFWSQAAIPCGNYITGPSYLLNWGVPMIDKIDAARMRAEAMAFTKMVLDISRVPKADLRRLDLKTS